MDQNRNALDSWSLDVILEDSVSGRMQTAAMCDALITDILGKPLRTRDFFSRMLCSIVHRAALALALVIYPYPLWCMCRDKFAASTLSGSYRAG